MKYIIFILILILGISGCLDKLDIGKNKINLSQNFNNNLVSDPIPVTTVTTSKFTSTYIDPDGNLHKVTDYTSQGGSKYDEIINRNKDITPIPTISKQIYQEKDIPINIISDTKNKISEMYNENTLKINDNTIDDEWVKEFMKIVNEERKKKGLHELWSSQILNIIAKERFKKMMERPFISHYGAETDMYNTAEEVLYPEGFTEKEYVNNLKNEAYIHWNGLMDARVSQYGFHIEKGLTLGIYQPCSATEIVGSNVDIKEFFKNQGCKIIEEESIWFVIEMQ